MNRILFIAAHRPDRSPSQRFRFEQYFGFLSENGFECNLSYLISEKTDISHLGGNYAKKAGIVLMAGLKRFADVLRAHQYDIIFIQREAFMLGTAVFERLFKLSRAKIIFDFDDSIWLHDISAVNKHTAFLKRPSKTSSIIKLSDWVIAGNEYLADYASTFNKNVSVIPTTIDTDLFMPTSPKVQHDKLTIGWSGSYSTIKHFVLALPALEEIKKKFADKVCFEVVGDGTYRHEALGIIGKVWSKEMEMENLLQFDIGIMPLPNDEWSKGKCGFKGLLYMSLEIPCILSPVGVNGKIIQDNQNGFLASTSEQWVEKLSRLLTDEALRKRLGEEGRKTVLKNYSVESQKHNYLQVFNKVAHRLRWLVFSVSSFSILVE